MLLQIHMLRLLGVVLLPMALVSAALGWRLLDREEREQKTAVLDVARALGGAVEAEVRRSISSLEILGLADHLSNENLDAFLGKLREASAIHGTWGNVGLFDPDGTLVRNANTDVGAPQPAIPRVDEVPEAAATGRALVSSLKMSASSGHHYIGVAVPVMRNGRAKYVLWARIDSATWTDFLKARVPSGWSAAINDRDGVVAARSDQPAVIGKTGVSTRTAMYRTSVEGVQELVGVTGQRVVSAFYRLEQPGLTVVAIAPSEMLLASYTRARVTLALGLFAIVALVTLLARLTVKPINTALATLRAGMQSIRDGTPFPPGRSGVHEVDEVMRAANDAAAAIREREAQAAESNRAKDRFIATLSHELRNPLAGISNAAQVLSKTLTEPEHLAMAGIVKRQSAHLSILVGDLLDVARAATGKLNIQRKPMDWCPVILEAIEWLKESGRLQTQELEIEGASSLWVNGDRARLYQVAMNMLDNASKFTEPDGRIKVRFRAEGHYATLAIEDNGRGISSAALVRIFEPFEQEPQELDRSLGGLGLGLAIARNIVNLHGGRIEATSPGPGQGTTVTVWLPLLARLDASDD